jgi:hypothetical protein
MCSLRRRLRRLLSSLYVAILLGRFLQHSPEHFIELAFIDFHAKFEKPAVLCSAEHPLS